MSRPPHSAPTETRNVREGQQLQTDWQTTLAKPHGFVWYTAVCISMLGVLSIGLGNRFVVFLGLALLAIGGSILALLSLATEFRLAFASRHESSRRLLVVALSAVGFVSTVALSSGAVPTGATLNVRIVILALGLQLLFLTTDVRPSTGSRRSRVVLLLVSHGTLLTASAASLSPGPQNFRAALLLYVVGFSFLSLHTFWSRQLRPGVSPPRPKSRRRYWESMLLVAIILGGLTAIVAVFTTPPPVSFSPTLSGRVIPRSLTGRLAAIIIGEAGVIGLAILGVPDSPPRALAALTGPLSTVVQHVLALLVLNNTLMLGIFLLVPQTYSWTLAAVLLILFVGITINYLSVGFSQWLTSQTDSTPEEYQAVPLTVVVSAANEASVLSETLRQNLSALPEAQFLLVPAAHSTDGTRDVMEAVQETAPERVRIIEGTSGSKAGDLNQVWDAITTPYVLLLDADETVTAGDIAPACRRLDSDPEIGIVQGRKVALYPGGSLLSGFVTVERQHSTWIHHPFVDRILDAGHFAGSAAVVRREVVPEADGFSPDMLTEDIDFTVGLYLETDWDLVYDPGMTVRELNPETWLSLIRQRERWARGWAQVAVRYGWDILTPRNRLGVRRTIGLSWELFTAISSPLYTLLPAFLVFWLFSPERPSLVFTSLLFTLYLLIERGISFSAAAFLDSEIPVSRRVRTLLLVVLYGYSWMLFGWVVQLHSLYLELAGATDSWDVTSKRLPAAESDDERTHSVTEPEVSE